MKINFVVPTPWRDPTGEIECVSNLAKIAKELNLDYKVFFVCNEWDIKTEFQQLKFDDPNIIIEGHNLNYSISKSVNIALQKSLDTDYFCFVQSDVHFKNSNWLRICIETYNSIDKVGVIGFRPHKSSNHILDTPEIIDSYELYPALWSDGFMFFKTSLSQEIGLFDEQYFGDCESQDFCYRLHSIGYTNYWLKDVKQEIEHRLISFPNKTNTNPELWMNKVEQSRRLFESIWNVS